MEFRADKMLVQTRELETQSEQNAATWNCPVNGCKHGLTVRPTLNGGRQAIKRHMGTHNAKDRKRAYHGDALVNRHGRYSIAMETTQQRRNTLEGLY